MTNGNGSSRTIVRDIFGDEIHQVTSPPSGEQPQARSSVYGSQSAYRPYQVQPAPPLSGSHGVGMPAQPHHANYGAGTPVQHHSAGYATGIQPQPHLANYGAGMHSGSQPSGHGTFGQAVPFAQNGYVVPNQSHQVVSQNGSPSAWRSRNKLGSVIGIITAVTLTVGAVGGAAFFGQKYWCEQMTKIQTEIGNLKKGLEGKILAVQNQVVSQDELNVKMQKVLADSTVYLKTSRQNSFGNTVEEEVGTGVVIDKGVVLTDLHLIKNVDRIFISTADGKHVFEARIIHDDPLHDKAILQVNGLEAPALPLAKDAAEKGAQVFCIGETLGEKGAFSSGEVSVPSDYEGYMLLSLPGKGERDSGSAVINGKGELVATITGAVINENGEVIYGLFRAMPVQDLNPIISWWHHNKGDYLEGSEVKA
ncbi:MAG: S1C family serine protease [Cyanobacteria bacterium]|nr:S1C family serine protease [Cyanobacteriota bacterium]